MTETLTIYPGVSGQERSYVPQRTLPDGRVRIDDQSTLLEPRLLTIRHTTSRGGSGNPKDVVVDRHLVSCSYTKRDATTGEETCGTVNLTFIVPRTATFDATEMGYLHTVIVQMLAGAPAIQAGLLRGES